MNLPRLYQPSDQSSVIELLESTFHTFGDGDTPLSQLDRWRPSASPYVYVIFNDSKCVGVVFAGYDGIRGWLYRLAVDPRYRRRGLGSKLIRAAEGKLQEVGCPKINLQIRQENSGVLAFYGRCGYQIEQRISCGKRLTP